MAKTKREKQEYVLLSNGREIGRADAMTKSEARTDLKRKYFDCKRVPIGFTVKSRKELMQLAHAS